jgi:hypothetical protein
MAKNGKALPSDFTGVDHKQAEYWLGGISREEIQPTFDEYGMNITAIKKSLWGVTKDGKLEVRGITHTVMQMDLVVAYICNKFGIKRFSLLG